MNNIGESFTFPFKDPDWVVKFLLGGIFSFLSIFLIGIPVLYGYYIELLQRVLRNEKYPLPGWKDPGIKFITGLKYIVTLFIYYLPLMIVTLPFVLIYIATIFTDNHYGNPLGSTLLILYICLIAIPYSLFVTLLTPAISILFAQRESIADGLRIQKVFKLFRSSWVDMFLIVILSFGLEILSVFGFLFFIVGILFTGFYVSLVIFHVYGRIARDGNC